MEEEDEGQRAVFLGNEGVNGPGFSRELEGELGYLLFLFCEGGYGKGAGTKDSDTPTQALQGGFSVV
jgi:hypothetical protein